MARYIRGPAKSGRGDRAATAMPSLKVKFMGIGNETWAAAATLAGYYADFQAHARSPEITTRQAGRRDEQPNPWDRRMTTSAITSGDEGGSERYWSWSRAVIAQHTVPEWPPSLPRPNSASRIRADPQTRSSGRALALPSGSDKYDPEKTSRG